MSPDTDGPLPRIKERRDQADLLERIAAYDLRSVPEPVPLAASRLARVAKRIENQATELPRRRATLWLSLATGIVLATSAVAFAQYMGVLPERLSRLLAPRPSPASQGGLMPRSSKPRSVPGKSPSTSGRETSSAGTQGTEDATKPMGDVTPASAPAKPSGENARKPVRVAPSTVFASSPGLAASSAAMTNEVPGAPSKPAAPSPAASMVPQPVFVPAPSPVAAPATGGAGAVLPRELRLALVQPQQPQPVVAPHPEPTPSRGEGEAVGVHQVLIQAVRALREDRQPQRALGLLDSRAGDFARSPFADEALRLRIEAHTKLGATAEALRLLDAMPLSDLDRSRDLLLERGRLRAAAGRCPESIRDLSLVLERSPRPPKEALIKRAECRRKLGDVAGAEADRERLAREWGPEWGKDGKNR